VIATVLHRYADSMARMLDQLGLPTRQGRFPISQHHWQTTTCRRHRAIPRYVEPAGRIGSTKTSPPLREGAGEGTASATQTAMSEPPSMLIDSHCTRLLHRAERPVISAPPPPAWLKW